MQFRDETGRKQCSNCKEWLSESDFAKQNTASDGLTSKCRFCRQRYMLKVKYGLEDDALYVAQHGCCAVCGKSLEDGFSVDHDHSCCPGESTCGNCVRGLLCNPCNLMLGLAGDSMETLEAAIKYLGKGPAR